ncbi:MAG: RhuM family protein [Candidatus Algichlamydia australiensis]|nr:RhuM family protein [Chlamydiales bacterium]
MKNSLVRIRDIRSSEKVFWRKVLDIYATSIDYDPNTETAKDFLLGETIALEVLDTLSDWILETTTRISS